MNNESEELFRELNPEKQTARRAWVESVRSHLANEHQRWGEGLFRNLMLADTGGVVVVASLMGQGKDYATNCWLRAALTLFVIGVVGALAAFGNEFAGITGRLTAWDKLSRPYLNNEIKFGQLYGPEKFLQRVTLLDWLIFAGAVVPFVLGCSCGIAYLWL